MQLTDLKRKCLLCSGQWLTKKLITGQSAEHKCSLNKNSGATSPQWGIDIISPDPAKIRNHFGSWGIKTVRTRGWGGLLWKSLWNMTGPRHPCSCGCLKKTRVRSNLYLSIFQHGQERGLWVHNTNWETIDNWWLLEQEESVFLKSVCGPWYVNHASVDGDLSRSICAP